MIEYNDETKEPFLVEFLLTIVSITPIINLLVLPFLFLIKSNKNIVRHYAVSLSSCYVICTMFLAVLVQNVSVKRNDLREIYSKISMKSLEDYALQKQVNKNKEEQLARLKELNLLKEKEVSLDREIESITEKLNSDVLTSKLYNLKWFDNATVRGSTVTMIIDSIKEEKVAILLSTKDFDSKLSGYYRAYGYLLSKTEDVLASTKAYKIPKNFKGDILTESYEDIKSIYEEGTVSYIRPNSDFFIRVYLSDDSAIIMFQEVNK